MHEAEPESGSGVEQRLRSSESIWSDVGSSVAVGQVSHIFLEPAIQTLSQAAPGDIQKIAATQIELLTGYYQSVLAQARTSFHWAVIAAVTGFAFFIGAIAFLLSSQSRDLAVVSVISGAIVEVVAGLNFYLYGMTTKQLAHFHQRLDQTQRYLLANSICEALNGPHREETRAALVTKIATYGKDWTSAPEQKSSE